MRYKSCLDLMEGSMQTNTPHLPKRAWTFSPHLNPNASRKGLHLSSDGLASAFVLLLPPPLASIRLNPTKSDFQAAQFLLRIELEDTPQGPPPSLYRPMGW